MHEAGTGAGLVLTAALAAWHHGQMNEFVDALSISSHINLNSIKNESRVDAPLKQIPYHSPKRHDSHLDSTHHSNNVRSMWTGFLSLIHLAFCKSQASLGRAYTFTVTVRLLLFKPRQNGGRAG